MGNKAIKSKVHPQCYFFGSDNASAKGARFKVSALRGTCICLQMTDKLFVTMVTVTSSVRVRVCFRTKIRVGLGLRVRLRILVRIEVRLRF